MNDSKRQSEAGFTLIEILVVIALLGIVLRIVVANAGAFIPETVVRSAAMQFRSNVDYIRSEAKIQGKPYSIELDMENHRFRLILPPEDKLVVTEEDTVGNVIPLTWTDLDSKVRYYGHAIAGGQIYTKGIFKITFDENGFSADQAIFFADNVDDAKLVWTVQIRGLSGSSKIIPDREGKRHPIPRIAEESF